MKWSEAKEKADNKVWADLELRPTGKSLQKNSTIMQCTMQSIQELIVDMLDHSMKKRGNICVSGIGLVVHHTISFFEINQRELLKQPLQTIGTLLKHSKNIMRIFLMAN